MSYNSERSGAGAGPGAGLAGSEVTGAVELCAGAGADPACGAFFQPDYKKNDDLKLMLDGSKDSLKLEAMKRIIGMIAKGRDASDLFPAVVKNVVSKNIEVKKLVYVYLVRYAEEQQDLALLSISTFQRALKDPNQLIRASALRVLSSIRVAMIVPIVMLAIRDAANDMSPYVRKTAAHAIPKLYSLDPEQKEELVLVIEKLLSDRAPLVVGSAAMAFQEVCPERSSLLHGSYRKLCSLLVDVDEWGQLVLLSVLTRYTRQHFTDPNHTKEGDSSSEWDQDKPFYEESESEGSEVKEKQGPDSLPDARALDADHRLLLRAAKPLLQSRNAGVVMAVAQLFYHAAPACEMAHAAKAMIRLLRGPYEVQSVVLHSIASLTISKRSIFEPYLKSFLVRTSEPTHIKLVKLEILTNLATETTVPVILREFQTYVTSSDKKFAVATVQAIGRIATNIQPVTETCLNGLLHLLSSKDEWLVGEAVVVVKRVVGGEGGGRGAAAAVGRAARLLRGGRLMGGGARAAALWLLAEHGASSRHAPVLLAYFTQQFTEQEELVKLQLLSLAVKLSITQPATCEIARHMLALARYDACYDVRDRARLLRTFLQPGEEPGKRRLVCHAAALFLADKPLPNMESKFKDRQQYTLGSLSHYVGVKAAGYTPLPVFPQCVLATAERDPDVNSAALPVPADTAPNAYTGAPGRGFYSGSEESDSSSEDSSSSGDNTDTTHHNVLEEEGDGMRRSRETCNKINYINRESGAEDSEDSEEDSNSNSDSDSSSSEEMDSDDETPVNNSSEQKAQNMVAVREDKALDGKYDKSNLELLLELDAAADSLPFMTPSYGGFLSPIANGALPAASLTDPIVVVSASHVERDGCELVSRLATGGLSVSRRFLRVPHLYSDKMAAVELTFHNHTQENISNIRLHKKVVLGSRAVHDFAPINELPPGGSRAATLGVDFADTIQPLHFTIVSSLGVAEVSLSAGVGELVRAVSMSEDRFVLEQNKLRGMTECEKKTTAVSGGEPAICAKVTEMANLAPITSGSQLFRFAGRTLSTQQLVLVSVRASDTHTHIQVNCPNIALASLLLNDITHALSS